MGVMGPIGLIGLMGAALSALSDDTGEQKLRFYFDIPLVCTIFP